MQEGNKSGNRAQKRVNKIFFSVYKLLECENVADFKYFTVHFLGSNSTSTTLMATSTMASIREADDTTMGVTGYITQDTMDSISFLPVVRHRNQMNTKNILKQFLSF